MGAAIGAVKLKPPVVLSEAGLLAFSAISAAVTPKLNPENGALSAGLSVTFLTAVGTAKLKPLAVIAPQLYFLQLPGHCLTIRS